MKNSPTPSMTTFRSVLHILNIHFSLISSFLIGTVPLYAMVNKAEGSQGWILVDYMIDIPYTNCNWSLNHYSGAEEGIDEHDAFRFTMFNPSGIAAEITSIVGGQKLGIDQRPLNSTSSVSFSYTVISQDGGDIPTINNPYLKVSTNGFNDEDVFISVEGVTYDAKSAGIIPLSNITGSGSVWFVPHAIQPQVETVETADVTYTTATLQGQVSNEAKNCEYWFTYWTEGGTVFTSGYGSGVDGP
ncbi:MAG TPA: hypothetical protein VLI39_03795, partial [Sedimentisphaerales bacterium]|nr:hypothetical protein [Sedimentisphaerales bacterium]